MATALAIAPGSAWLATVSNDKTVRIWDSATGRPTATLSTDPAEAPAITPDGRLLATISHDRTIRIWDRTSGEIITMMRTDSDPVTCAWTADGRSLIVGGERGVYRYEFRPGTPDR
ncbi:WD40 repeat domain-containing protein [Frankia sp. CiP1_Cm_nod2]|uniref:WD40 repeat domain-containing protein n=1 Tax=Frankia sp. CiP1_Cm_nod2 TaxID=2897161 RepID=UPI004044C029